MVSSVKTPSKNLSDQFHILYQNRYCDQEEFSIGLFSDAYYSGDVSTFKPFLLKNFDTKMYLPSLSRTNFECKAVSIGSEIYVSGDFDDYSTLSFVRYSSSTKTWFKLPETKELKPGYYMSSFMQKVFIINEFNYENSWYYDIKTNIWTSIASMIEKRRYAACAVFEGKIVVSGGKKKEKISNEVNQDGSMYLSLGCKIIKLKSIEGYDFYENKWYYFPEMLSPRSNHFAISIGNKMFF